MTGTSNTEAYDKFGQFLVELFGDRLADPNHSPIEFAYQVKLAKYEQLVQAATASPSPPQPQ